MEKARGIMRFREEAKSGNGETRNFVGFRGGGLGRFVADRGGVKDSREVFAGGRAQLMIFVNDLISLLDLATTMENVIPMSIRGPLLKFELLANRSSNFPFPFRFFAYSTNNPKPLNHNFLQPYTAQKRFPLLVSLVFIECLST